MTTTLLRTGLLLAATAAAGPALAHGGHTEGLGAGLAHPMLGIDHLVAMAAVGIWAAQARSWALPLAFLAGMAGGIGLGVAAGVPGWMEHGVAGTVLALGLILALGVPLRAVVALPLAAGFGLLHGAVHGGEIGGAGFATALGMLAGSAVLHAAGFAIGRAAAGRMVLARAGGAGIAAAGAVLLLLA